MRNLLILLLLVVATWLSLIVWDSPPDFFMRDKAANRADLPLADSYMRTTDTTKYGEDGRRAYLLTSDTGLYFRDTGRLELTAPRLTFNQSGDNAPPWQVTSEDARSEDQGTRMFLTGEVHAWQELGDGRNEIFTTDIEFRPNTHTAETAAPVKLVSPRGITTATGMEANFEARVFRLTSNVESTLYGR